MSAAFLGAESKQIDSNLNVTVITAYPKSEIFDRIPQPPKAGNSNNKVRGFS
jgi:hypothetical protein